MRSILVDDDPNARKLMRSILEEFCPEVTLAGEAGSLEEGVKVIRREQPDLVFLDVEMPGGNGTDILDHFPTDEVSFQIVFVTGHSDYAIKAFKINAIDYLLKPAAPSQVQDAVSKALKKNNQEKISEQLEALKNSLKVQNFAKIGLPVSDGILFVKTEDIISLEASGMYTKVVFRNEEELLVSKPLRHIADLLSTHESFYRPHRSYVINLNFIQQYVRKDGGYILLENGEQVPVSREKKEDMLLLLGM